MTSISSTDSSFSEWSLSTDTEQQISYMLDQFVKEQDYSPAQTSTPPPPSPPPQTTMPNGLETRLKRVSKECIRVLSSEMIKYRHQHEFKVRGSTGKVYTTTIGPKLDCTCYDHKMRGAHCKHILYILLKELQIEDLTNIIYMTQFPSDQLLQDIFSHYHAVA